VVSKAKLYSRLDVLEIELKERLVPHLKNSVDGKNDLLFCVKNFNSFRELKSRTDKYTEELIEIGSQILSLREKLGESSDGTMAERICWYCREWSRAKNYHKALGAELAKQFLMEIEKT
jgi:hypothetical protein